MSITFLWPDLLLLVPLLLGTALLAWWLADRRRSRSSSALADERLFTTVVRPPRRSRVRLLRVLQLSALAVLLIAAARPQATPLLPVNRAATVVALDASRSMLANDVDPNRLEVARELAKSFVEGAPGSARIGVASFSDSAFVLVPPTSVKDEVIEALERVDAASNTSLAAAIVAGVRMLPGRTEARPPEPLDQTVARSDDPGGAGDRLAKPDSKPAESGESLPPGRILVLSDGVANVSSQPGLPAADAVELALAFAEEQQVQVYTVPVGREGGTVAWIDGQNYFVPFDGDALERISERTGGLQLDPDEPEELREAFRDLGRDIRWEATALEVSSLLSAVAALLLLVAGGVALVNSRRLP